jgi:hypothetical protein
LQTDCFDSLKSLFIYHWAVRAYFSDSLLDSLSQMNIEQLRDATTQIEQKYGQAPSHDWRGFLWLDYDLSGLICSQQAEGSEKGYFSGKKTLQDDS